MLRRGDNIRHGSIIVGMVLTMEYLCSTQVEEFCKGAPAHHLNHPEEGVYLIWKWDWIMPTRPLAGDVTPPIYNGSECESVHDHTDEEENGEQADDEPAHHTVLFKCIGATRDQRQQTALERTNELLREKKDVTVALFPEPTNPVDSKAIAIKCELDNSQWHRIGYIVHEALDDVHEALHTKAIVSVSFGWVKFRIDFQRSGPGFYAGIAITRRGRWSARVCSCASKM